MEESKDDKCEREEMDRIPVWVLSGVNIPTTSLASGAESATAVASAAPATLTTGLAAVLATEAAASVTGATLSSTALLSSPELAEEALSSRFVPTPFADAATTPLATAATDAARKRIELNSKGKSATKPQRPFTSNAMGAPTAFKKTIDPFMSPASSFIQPPEINPYFPTSKFVSPFVSRSIMIPLSTPEKMTSPLPVCSVASMSESLSSTSATLGDFGQQTPLVTSSSGNLLSAATSNTDIALGQSAGPANATCNLRKYGVTQDNAKQNAFLNEDFPATPPTTKRERQNLKRKMTFDKIQKWLSECSPNPNELDDDLDEDDDDDDDDDNDSNDKQLAFL